MKLSETIVAKSDQLNAEDLVSGPRIITVTTIKAMPLGNEQPWVIEYEGANGRPWKPSKAAMRILASEEAWGDLDIPDGGGISNGWAGRQVEVFNNPEVIYAGKKCGGIRVSGMSHIKNAFVARVTERRGSKTEYKIRVLTEAQAAPQQDFKTEKDALTIAAESGMAALVDAWKSITPQARDALAAHKDSLKAGLEKTTANNNSIEDL